MLSAVSVPLFAWYWPCNIDYFSRCGSLCCVPLFTCSLRAIIWWYLLWS